MAFLNPDPLQCGNTSLSQRATDSLVSVGGMDGQMVQIAASAAMSAQNSTNSFRLVFGDKTHPWVSCQVRRLTVFGIRAAEPDTFTAFPERDDILVSSYFKFIVIYPHMCAPVRYIDSKCADKDCYFRIATIV